MIYFGLEIEIIGTIDKLKKLNEEILYDTTQFHNIVQINRAFKEESIYFVDTTIMADNLYELGYEIKTEKLRYTIDNLNLVKDLLNLISIYTYANSNCSVHVHVSDSNMSLFNYYELLYNYINLDFDRDMLYHYIINEENPKKNLNLRLSDSIYADYSKCRNKYFKYINNHIANKTIYKINEEHNSYKNTLYRINHEYYTLEYRGMRHHFELFTPDLIIQYTKKFINNFSILSDDMLNNPATTLIRLKDIVKIVYI